MKTEGVTEDYWIMAQLAGIRLLEHELNRAFKRPGKREAEDLRRRVAELNYWLNVVESALAVRTRSAARPNALEGGVVSYCNAGSRLPAA